MRAARLLSAAAVLAVATTACSGGNVFELSVGDCFQDPDASDTQISDVELVDCSEAHDNEVFHAFDLPEGEYPGDTEVSTSAQETCTGEAFASYFDADYATSEVYASWLTPTEDSWAQGDREVVCFGYVPEEQITGSLAGSGR